MIIIGGTALGIVAFLQWIRSDEARKLILNFFIDVPYVGGALVNLYFGLWCRYMAMMHSAGIPTIEALRVTAGLLPTKLQISIEAMADDLELRNRRMDEAAEPKNWEPDDPRHVWPYYVTHAFIVSERTGEIDTAMSKVAGALIKVGMLQMKRAVIALTVISYILAGGMIGVSAFVYYLPILNAARYT
jgi:type II secretory pathway component PulF